MQGDSKLMVHNLRIGEGVAILYCIEMYLYKWHVEVQIPGCKLGLFLLQNFLFMPENFYIIVLVI